METDAAPSPRGRGCARRHHQPRLSIIGGPFADHLSKLKHDFRNPHPVDGRGRRHRTDPAHHPGQAQPVSRAGADRHRPGPRRRRGRDRHRQRFRQGLRRGAGQDRPGHRPGHAAGRHPARLRRRRPHRQRVHRQPADQDDSLDHLRRGADHRHAAPVRRQLHHARAAGIRSPSAPAATCSTSACRWRPACTCRTACCRRIRRRRWPWPPIMPTPA
jgi:hypothetical protein